MNIIFPNNIDILLDQHYQFQRINFKKLSSQQIQVLEMRFGLGGRVQMTLEDIGLQFDVTKTWIQQIEKKALGILHKK